MLALVHIKLLPCSMNFHYRKELGVQCVTSCLSQQLNIGGDTSQSHKVLNGNKSSETSDAYINTRAGMQP